MKTTAFVLLAGAGMLCGGCSVEQTVTVQNLDVIGPKSYPHIYITDDSVNAIRAAVHFSSNPQGTLEGSFTNEAPTTSSSTAQPAPPAGKVRWAIPKFNAGLDCDFPLSRAFSLTLGANTSDNLWGFNLGCGLRSEGTDAAVRLDLGFQWQSLTYDINYALTTTITSIFGESDQTRYFQKHETTNHGDFYGAVTVNSKNLWGSANVFLQTGYVRQTLFDIRADVVVFPLVGWSKNTSVSSSYFVLTPGICFDLSRSFRIVAGARCAWDVGFDSSDPSFLVSPVLLFDFGL